MILSREAEAIARERNYREYPTGLLVDLQRAFEHARLRNEDERKFNAARECDDRVRLIARLLEERAANGEKENDGEGRPA